MRILFVAIPNNVHSARWINQIAELGWDLHVFPCYEGALHPNFKNVTAYYVADRQPNPRVKARVVWPLSKGGDRLRALSGRFPPQFFSRAAWLARVIRRIKPDLIHTLEFQRAGYLTLEAKSMFGGDFPPWMTSNWGSDIYLFGPLSQHREKIKAILSSCDYYSSECRRDVELAREYGFKGEAWPVMPAAGGFNLEEMRQYRQPGPPSARRLIALKGYQHWAGRALAGLRAIELCADQLKAGGYSFAVYLANPDVQLAAERVSVSTGLPLEDISTGSREDVLRMHGRARASIGVSISDGLSTSALEALVMGSLPIQSNTSCLTEMARDGESALIVPPEDPFEIAAAIRRAVTDDELVDRAAELNARIASERLSEEVVQPQVVAMYRKVAASLEFKSKPR
ncbi:MAG TPA: glycosyltransferase [Pyrinomonadaceae bacterium]|nr:glycosyltransferase [Pyrinomonadaceae bacterium]